MGRTACTEPQYLYKGALKIYLYLYLYQSVYLDDIRLGSKYVPVKLLQ
jgi:hypothetical protein